MSNKAQNVAPKKPVHNHTKPAPNDNPLVQNTPAKTHNPNPNAGAKKPVHNHAAQAKNNSGQNQNKRPNNHRNKNQSQAG
jgi:hypothetical protein